MRRETLVEARHLERLALVYVRQSTLAQVREHRESTRLQYGLEQLAVELGWPRDRIRVVDEDLGVFGILYRAVHESPRTTQSAVSGVCNRPLSRRLNRVLLLCSRTGTSACREYGWPNDRLRIPQLPRQPSEQARKIT